MIKRIIQKSFRMIGLEIERYSPISKEDRRRIAIMKNLNINSLFDIGANVGQYGLKMRQIGYDDRIISFEPLKEAFAKLKESSLKDPKWQVHNYAIGSEDCMNTINIAGNSYSSSILEMLPSHIESAPDSKYISKEEIEVKRLDSVFNSFYTDNDKVMLKIDTQGYEKNVIEGASKILDKISLIQLEMSIIPLYDKEMLFAEMIINLEKKGFQLVSLEKGFSDRNTGQLLQVDGIFVNKLLLTKSKLH